MWKFWQNLGNRLQNHCMCFDFTKTAPKIKVQMFFFFYRSCFCFVLFGQVRGDLGKFNNGAWIVLWFKQIHSTWEEMQSFFWRSFSLEFFSGKFGEIWAKILHTPKNLHAPPMVRVPRFKGKWFLDLVCWCVIMKFFRSPCRIQSPSRPVSCNLQEVEYRWMEEQEIL